MFNNVYEEKMSMVEILKTAFKVLKGNFKTFAALCFIFNAPVCAIYVVMLYYLSNNDLYIQILKDPQSIVEAANQSINNPDISQIIKFAMIYLLIAYFITPVLKMAIAILTDSVIKEKPLKTSGVMALTSSRVGVLAIASIVHFSLMSGSMFLIIVPAIIYIFLIFTPYIIAIRQRNSLSAIFYSYKLVSGQFLMTFLYFSMMFSLNYMVSSFAQSAITFLPVFFTFIFIALLDSFFYIAYTIWFINIDFIRQRNITKIVLDKYTFNAMQNKAKDDTQDPINPEDENSTSVSDITDNTTATSDTNITQNSDSENTDNDLRK